MDRREHAVVIGASMGGLAAAGALAPYYRRVTVLDRDALPDGPQPRRGVPQGRHAHGLQPGGIRAWDALLAGLVDDLVANGAPTGDLNEACAWVIGGRRLARGEIGVPGIGLTRPFFEHHVRAHVAALPGVVIRDQVDVIGPVASDPRRVIGVEVTRTGGGPVEQISADLVVDASGKGSRLPRWLSDLGYRAPAEEQVACKMAYLTRRWRLAPGACTDVATVITPADTPRFGVMIEQEDGTHIVTLGGLLDSGPERTDEGYVAFAARLPDQAIADALVGATPVTDLQPSHFPASRRRRYDQLRAFPAGLLALGDSIASFNPMYGQGMTVAALQGVALRDALARGPLDARKYFARAHRIEDVAWKIATGGDLRFDEVEGKRSRETKIMNRYLGRLTMAARTDPVLARQFLLVAGFIVRPETLFKPSIVWRVLAGARAQTRSPQPVRETVGARSRGYSGHRPCLRPRSSERTRPQGMSAEPIRALMVSAFAIAAASWAVLMAVAPLLQVRRMIRRRSSDDVSLGYLLILLPGFALWVAYGVASADLALVVPNAVAFAVASATVACALRLRRVHRS